MALTQTQVSQLYVSIFGRASEGEGNTYWQTNATDMATAATQMLATDDAIAYFGSSLDSDLAFVTHIYLNTLNKTYADDATGIDYWVAELASGVARGTVVANLAAAVNDYATSTDPVTLAAYNQFTNRVTVSNYMADTVQEAPADYATSTRFASSGTTGLVVTSDAATVESAQLAVGDIVAPSYTLAAAATSVTEGNSVVFTVTTSHAVSTDTVVNYQIQGVAVAGGTATPVADLGVLNGTLTIAAGATTGTITLTPSSDSVTEGYEGFKVVLLDSSFATIASSGNVVIQDPENAGQTFTLTTGVDKGAAFTGTAGNDTFDSNMEYVSTTKTVTLGALDVLDGGAGTDKLVITNDTGDYKMAAATISNIETITIAGAAKVEADVSTAKVTGLETLTVTQAADDVTLTAAATTDVNVSGVDDSAAAVATLITGGKTVTVNQAIKDGGSTIKVEKAVNVNITATDTVHTASAIDAVVVGSSAANAATGTVDVTVSGAKIVGGAAAATLLNDIVVTGGTVVNVTQKATSDLGDIATKAADITKDKVTQGTIDVNTTNVTTDVTIKQDATQTGVVAANTTGAVTETASVKFGLLKAGDKLTIDTDAGNDVDATELTLTAVTDMTAAEVAQAFANLVNNAAFGAIIAAGDTQSATTYTKATYAGKEAVWSSATASGDTVVFTSNTANSDVANDLAFKLTDAGTALGVAPIVTTTQGKTNDATMAGGKLDIVAGVVTVAAGTTGTALKTVTIDGYGGTTSAITGTAAALETINLSNGAAFTVSDTASTVTLNLEKVTGAVTFTAEPTTLNVKSIGDNTGGVVAVANTTALNVSGTGTLTSPGSLAAVKNITVTETAGLNLTSATLTALESVNTTGTTGATTVSILGAKATYTGGAGVDTVTVSDADTAIAKAIDLGAGNDKLILAGTAVVAIPAVELKGGEGTDTLSIDAADIITTALSANTAFAAKLNSFERLEITGATGAQAVNVEKLGFASYVTVTGVAAAGTLTLNDLANNATVVLNATNTTGGLTTVIKDAATGLTDVLNVEVTNNSTIAAGTLTATNIETVKLTVTDSNVTSTTPQDAVHTMTLTADKATALTIDGNAGLTLTLSGTNALATVTATDMTATLTLNLSAHNGVAMTVNGGSGADVLTATVGANAKADVLNGGAGNDILTAGTNGAKLTGGAGNDLFVLNASTSSQTVKGGTGEATTHSYITDFQAGDLLQLSYNTSVFGTSTGTNAVVTGFAKLAANQSANAVYADYVKAAIAQAGAGEAVWFSFADNSYVIVDSGADSATVFDNGVDLAIELTGVANLDNASFNSTYGTIAIG